MLLSKEDVNVLRLTSADAFELAAKVEAAILAKLATLEADAERLDYLQQGVTVELLYSGLAPDFRIGGHIAGTSHDIRAAIDAAKGGQHEDA